MLTLEQLTTPVTEDEALATILEVLSELGFQATSWQTGSAQMRFVRLLSRVWSSVTSTVSLIAAGGFTTLAAQTVGASGYLTLLARYVYDEERDEAQQAIGEILLTSSAGAPVHTFAAGDLIVSDAEQGTDGANTYTCTEGGTIGPGTTLSIEFKADVAGAAANIAPNTTLYLWTPLVGVEASNPALVPDSNTWITTPGADEESDTRLAEKCIAKWSTLNYGNMDGAYKYWSLKALPAATRLEVESAAGDGTVVIHGATALTPLDAGQCTTIEEYIYGVTDGVGRRPINDIVSVVPATVQTTPALVITPYVISSVFDTIATTMTSALLNYIGSIPLGGTVVNGSQGRVLFSKLMQILQSQTGVRSVAMNITEDIPLDPGEIYVPSITVNPVLVAPGNE